MVAVGWIIFRAPTMSDAANYILRMTGGAWADMTVGIDRLSTMIPDMIAPLTGILLMMAAEWRINRHRPVLPGWFVGSVCLRNGLYVVMTMITIAFAGSQSEFIYFQF